MGLSFRNDLGNAAGLDKDGSLLEFSYELGAGYTVVGTVLSEPHTGNVFRFLGGLWEGNAWTPLPHSGAALNSLGLPSRGVDAAVAKAVAEALEAKARERATKEKELDQSLQWARETHARELANARKEMAEAVAAKDAEVRAAQDAHTRLLDAEAKRRADVQRAVEEKEMKLARDHAKKLSRLADSSSRVTHWHGEI